MASFHRETIKALSELIGAAGLDNPKELKPHHFMRRAAADRVNTIAPGLVATPMMLTLPAELQKSLTEAMPFPQRLIRADEFSRLCLHIIENVALNGEVIRLDNAVRLQPK